ncbi:MAG: hypothetical protein M1828_005469 [Chrysothrix sp. TS-e1954]|nr:MAG: hypothetical protein M1828_005469 [Chrysothrix sp. TS-e1954]
MARVDRSNEAEELWRHYGPTATRMWSFMQHVNNKHRLSLRDYADLYEWSTTSISSFWEEVWHFTGVKSARSFQSPIVDDAATMFPRPTFARDASMNFAENLLFPAAHVDPSSPAIIAATETTRETVSWKDLRERVCRCQGGMSAAGVREGDRIAGLTGNHTNAVVAMLGATSLGAMWTAISPDSGVSMVLDRLRQIEPKILFADASQEYNGKTHDVLPKVKDIVAELPTLTHVVILPSMSEETSTRLESLKPKSGSAISFTDFESSGQSDQQLLFTYLPADHPIYILYSSGTTGAPKCIVHGCIGTLLQHKKEHELHGDLRTGDRLFYFTTCTWMMWHWLVSALASGVTLVLYDGSPMRYLDSSASTPTSKPDDLALPRLITELYITQFGTSAKYLSLLEQKSLFPQEPPHSIPLSKTLKAVYNTASPLAPSTFHYVYKAFGPDINLASITGGTDIVSLFGAPCSLTPVYAGEVQVPGLGMAIRAYSDEGEDITETGQPGDLVCVKPFPCQPVGFWPLGSQEGEERYRKSYFDRFKTNSGKPIWHHGDYVQFNRHACPRPSQSGFDDVEDNHYNGLTMLGRSDGVLNPSGIRFGSAEIYNVLLRHFPGVIADSLCVGMRREGESDERVVLFVRMEDGRTFSDDLASQIKKAIRGDLSARHVPSFVDECPDIPVTVNGKKVEGEVKKIVSGSTVKASASIANAECLEFYRQWARSHA